MGQTTRLHNFFKFIKSFLYVGILEEANAVAIFCTAIEHDMVAFAVDEHASRLSPTVGMGNEDQFFRYGSEGLENLGAGAGGVIACVKSLT